MKAAFNKVIVNCTSNLVYTIPDFIKFTYYNESCLYNKVIVNCTSNLVYTIPDFIKFTYYDESCL